MIGLEGENASGPSGESQLSSAIEVLYGLLLSWKGSNGVMGGKYPKEFLGLIDKAGWVY